MNFSLIMATYGEGKIVYIKDFIDSLAKQKNFEGDIELIIIDQNENDTIYDNFSKFETWFSIKIIKSKLKGLSLARNIGIRAAKYSNLSFPDDDCLYPQDTLFRVTNYFSSNPKVDILTVDTRDSDTGKKLSYTAKMKGELEIKKNDIFKSVTSISVFLKNANKIYFDELLGLGAKFNSCEEFDYVIRQMLLGKKCYFTDTIHVLHPDHVSLDNDNLIKKIKHHAPGHGAFFRKHFFEIPKASIYYMLISPIGGVFYYGLQFKINKSQIYLNFLLSRISGFFSYKNHA